MGNISSPVITRLGVNQFWYKHWYSDKNYAQNLHQDKFFEVLLKFYLDYGITYRSNPFFNEYFFKKNQKNLRTQFNNSNMRFFRRFFYSNDIVGIEHSYLLRNHSGEYFSFRLWVMKFLGWVVFSLQWFKPIKKRSKRLGKLGSRGKVLNSINVINRLPNSGLGRLKTTTYFLLKKLIILKKKYCF